MGHKQGNKIMNKLKMLLAASSLVASVTAANAVALTYDFGAATVLPVQSSISYTIGGINFTATAKAINTSGAVLESAKVGQYKDLRPNEGGLGVTSRDDTNHEIDGGTSIGLRDLLLLTFDRPVQIIKATFSRVDSRFNGDDAYITIDGTKIDADGLKDLDVAHPGFLPLFKTGTTFGIGAIAADDDFKLRSITISPVPVPPAAILLLSGLAGMGALARRRKESK
jgi:hypothetical protein